MTRESLTARKPAPTWIDQAFLWTASSLTVIAIAATIPGPGVRPAGDRLSRRATLARPVLRGAARPAAPAAPPPLIAFGSPVIGYPVVSPFGLRQLPWEETGRLHKGVDIAAPEGTPVLAAANGVVVRTGVDPGYGRFVQVQHAAGLSTLYGHLDRFAPGVRPGAAVREGQLLGPMGSTGSSTGSHLHFEVHDADGRPLNPQLFMGRTFKTSRDLPLRQALRLPRGLRIAFVSVIPFAKEAKLLEHEDEEAAELEAAQKARAEAAAEVHRGEARLANLADAAVSAPASALASSAPAAAVPVAAPSTATRVEARLDPGG